MPHRWFRSSAPVDRTRQWTSISTPPPAGRRCAPASRPTSVPRAWRRRPRAVYRPLRRVSTALTRPSARRRTPVPHCRIPKSVRTIGGAATTIAATFNSMQVCPKAQCPFSTADSENLQIPQYKHAVVMGVNKNKTPGRRCGVLLPHHRRQAHRGLRGGRRRSAGVDHEMAAARRGHRDHQVALSRRLRCARPGLTLKSMPFNDIVAS